jgi:hypothetical protein
VDELDLIARLPASGDDTELPDGAAKARVRTRVMATIAASETDRQHARRHARRSSATRTVRLGIAAAIGALTVALIVPVMFTDRPGASASAALLRLAETASALRGWEHPTPNQFIYTRSAGLSPVCHGDSCVLEPFERESWIAPDGSGRIVETRGDQRSDESFGPGQLAFRDLMETLGWSQVRIRRHIEELAGVKNADDFTTFVVIGQLMGETQLLAEKRIDLFRIAATLPDTELLGPSTDELGRSGIGIGYSSGGLRYEVIFDRDSALVLEEQVASLGEGSEPVANAAAPGGWLVAGSRSTFEGSALVPTATERM